MLRRASLMFLSLFPFITPAMAATTAAPAAPAAPPRQFFVLIHTPGLHWDHTKAFGSQPGIAEHVAFMRWFFNHGKLVLGGPFLDNSGGMAVFAVPSEALAQRIAAADPAVKSGLLRVEVKPWLDMYSR